MMVMVQEEMWTSSVVQPQAGPSHQQDADIEKSCSTSTDGPPATRGLPLTPSPTGNTPAGLGPFADITLFRQFIMDHPTARKVCVDVESGAVSVSTRQLLVKTAGHKLTSMFGFYPDKMHIIRASVVMGDLLGMPANCFYDTKSFDGFLPRFLQNRRRKLPDSQKKCPRVKKSKVRGPPPLSASSPGSSHMMENEADDSSHECPRMVTDCKLCLGKDRDAERDRFKLLSVQRFDDMKSAALATFCQRRRWIDVDKPLLNEVLREYPKFQSTPQLLDLEFATHVPDAVDFLVEFPNVMEQLWRHVSKSAIPAVRQAGLDATGVDLEWKAWYALKALCLILRPSSRKRISSAEGLQSLCRIVPVGSSLESEAGKLPSYSPVLLIQGEIGGVVASIKVAAETKLLEAGSTVVEGIDRMFKIYWIFHMTYPDNCANILKFLESKAYNIQHNKKMPATVRELCNSLNKCV